MIASSRRFHSPRCGPKILSVVMVRELVVKSAALLQGGQNEDVHENHGDDEDPERRDERTP